MMSKKIAVFYLARLNEGFAAFEAFAESYRTYPAGEDHDLVIICKGFSKPGHHAAIGAIFTGIPHTTISVADDIGMDIHAYREASLRVDNEYVCCINTFTRFQAADWLAKLWKNLNAPGVGIVGATGSFESLYSTFRVANFVVGAAGAPPRFDIEFTRAFEWLINSSFPVETITAKSRKRRIRRVIGDLYNKRPTISDLEKRYPGPWASTTSTGGGFASNFRDFPHFPNPHLRTTAFLVRREHLLAIELEDRTKIACCRFESGPEGLSALIMSKGLSMLMVGADGVGYSLEQWPECGSFRSGNQSNLLARDNQTDAYNRMSAAEKHTHQVMTWGGYAKDIPDDASLYGTSFARSIPLAERAEQFLPLPKPEKTRLFSIAIPTHNRLDLVLDAIRTVTAQKYDNWEVVVFDNCSKEPIADAIAALGDPRIRSKRSDKFLAVTDSWNNAINMAKGDFVTMVGDDDGIAPGYFEHMNYLIDKFDNTDLVFTNLYQFMHPGVVPTSREGYVASLPMADFMVEKDHPFVVDKAIIRQSVDNSLGMRRSFMFNMPAFCSSRELLDGLRVDGQVLHSPFPDYYFANLVLERATKVVAEPKPMAFQGVSKVSFGFSFINAKLDDAFKTLNHDVSGDVIYNEVLKHLLPGSRYNSEYIVTMAYLAHVLGDPSRHVDFSHYRKIQIWNYLQSHTSLFKWRRTESGTALWSKLSADERKWTMRANTTRIMAIWFPKIWGKGAARLRTECYQYLFEATQVIYAVGEHVTLTDVYKDIEKGALVSQTQRERLTEVLSTPRSSRKKKPSATEKVVMSAN